MLEDLLAQKRDDILERWFRLVVETYPPGTTEFLRKGKNQFRNPIGYTIRRETEVLYDELVRPQDAEKLSASLDSIIKIKSVQDFSPARALAFVFFLKQAIRQELKNEIAEAKVLEELLAFELKIDELALRAFDNYMERREKIYEIRVKEAQNERDRAFRMLQATNLAFKKVQGEDA